MSNLGDVLGKLMQRSITNMGLGTEPPAAGDFRGLGTEPHSLWAIFVIFSNKRLF